MNTIYYIKVIQFACHASFVLISHFPYYNYNKYERTNQQKKNTFWLFTCFPFLFLLGFLWIVLLSGNSQLRLLFTFTHYIPLLLYNSICVCIHFRFVFGFHWLKGVWFKYDNVILLIPFDRKLFYCH